jgi:hypothetical protein
MTDCVRSCYHCFAVFYILVTKDILIIYYFTWVYKYDHKEIELIVTSLILFHVFCIRSEQRINFSILIIK